MDDLACMLIHKKLKPFQSVAYYVIIQYVVYTQQKFKMLPQAKPLLAALK